MLWRLYAATANYLTRSLDDDRLHLTQQHLAKADRVAEMVRNSACAHEVDAFLEGFPTRYLETHSAEEIAGHLKMAAQLSAGPVQLELRVREGTFELTVLTMDRPFLFASLTGTLAAWGMNILKADAFANATGTVLDTLRFADLFRTLELNPSEAERFKRDIVDVLTGKVTVQELMSRRRESLFPPPPKVRVPTQIRFDATSSSHSTLLELISQDRPGLLYKVSSALAELGLNIEVALIDTEGQRAIDVFYLTHQGAKLSSPIQAETQQRLLARLEADLSAGSPSAAVGRRERR
jgi:[protein-PII] uridylyltransferase